VRGLKAPPRYKVAPDFRTACPIETACVSDSTAQGPATTARRLAPTRTPPIETTVFSRLASRETSLYGAEDRDDFENARQVFERRRIDGAPVARDPDRGPLGSRHRMGVQAHTADRLDDAADLLGGRRRVHDDEHRGAII
jgi:hypothetical protein